MDRGLYVTGLATPRAPHQFFQTALESDPSFEAAQFELAVALEMIWRRRPSLERSVAGIVRREYERVLACTRARPGMARSTKRVTTRYTAAP